MENAVATLQIDNARVRVTEWAFKPGTETGFHTHLMDYVVIPTTSGMLTISDADGNEVEKALVAGQSYSREAGVAHNVMNRSTETVVFVEVEMKNVGTDNLYA